MSVQVSKKEWDRIHAEYEHQNNKNDLELTDAQKAYSDWQKIYCEGCDSKYGTIMVSHGMKVYRSLTMKEFYGNGPWD